MGRSTEDATTDPLSLIVKFARLYTHGPRNQYYHVFFFSKDHQECEALLMFGGKVYRQRGGWAWVCGQRKQLTALCKLLEPFDTSVFDPKLRSYVTDRSENEN